MAPVARACVPGSSPGRKTARDGSLSVARLDDGGLQSIHRLLGRRAVGDDTFVEAAPIRVAVVASYPEDDGALLLHRNIAGLFGANAVVHGLERAVRRVAAVQSEAAFPVVLVRGVADEHRGHEVVGDRSVGGNVAVLAVLPTRKEAIF